MTAWCKDQRQHWADSPPRTDLANRDLESAATGFVARTLRACPPELITPESAGEIGLILPRRMTLLLEEGWS